MADADARIALHSALRQLATEARVRAGLTDAGSSDHDFYSGVRKAAEDNLSSASQQDGGDLAREPDAFREGYLKVAAMISAVSANPPVHLAMPLPDLEGNPSHEGRSDGRGSGSRPQMARSGPSQPVGQTPLRPCVPCHMSYPGGKHD